MGKVSKGRAGGTEREAAAESVVSTVHQQVDSADTVSFESVGHNRAELMTGCCLMPVFNMKTTEAGA